jgi:hypothetical protein
LKNPVVFISRNRIKDGKVEEIREHYQSSVQPVQEGKPNTLLQLAFKNSESTEFTVIRVFRNPDALDMQIQGADQRSKKTYEYIEPTMIEIFGTPNPSTLEKMKQIAGSGVEVKIDPDFLGGFIRLDEST